MNAEDQEVNHEFTIRGDLRIEANTYSMGADKGAQILCFADVEYCGDLFQNLLLLVLDIEGSADTQWLVKDKLSDLVAYMKPVGAFRVYLIDQLEKFRYERLPKSARRSPHDPRAMGIGKYVNDLREYSEARVLANQLKSLSDFLMNRIRKGDPDIDEVKVKNILVSLLTQAGAIPKTERQFIRKV